MPKLVIKNLIFRRKFNFQYFLFLTVLIHDIEYFSHKQQDLNDFFLKNNTDKNILKKISTKNEKNLHSIVDKKTRYASYLRSKANNIIDTFQENQIVNVNVNDSTELGVVHKIEIMGDYFIYYLIHVIILKNKNIINFNSLIFWI